MLDCILRNMLRRLPTIIGATLVAALLSLLAAAILCAIVSAVGAEAPFLPCFLGLLPVLAAVVGVFGAMLVIGALIRAFYECWPVVPRGGVIDVTGLVVPDDIDCAEAQALRDQAQAAVDAAEQAVREQEEEVAQAREKLNNARAVASGIAAAIAVALSNPFEWGSIGALIASAIAAAAVIARRAGRLREELARLAELAAVLLQAQLQLAGAQALVDALCPPEQPPDPSGGGTTPVTPPATTVDVVALGV